VKAILTVSGPGYRDSARSAAHYEGHAAITSSAASFAAATRGRYLWDAAASIDGTRIVGGRCRACGSDLAIALPPWHALVVEMDGRWLVELESGVWIAAWGGDPGRTTRRENAQAYESREVAAAALDRARQWRPFERARIYEGGPV
jgi:hypothetical protein